MPLMLTYRWVVCCTHTSRPLRLLGDHQTARTSIGSLWSGNSGPAAMGVVASRAHRRGDFLVRNHSTNVDRLLFRKSLVQENLRAALRGRSVSRFQLTLLPRLHGFLPEPRRRTNLPDAQAEFLKPAIGRSSWRSIQWRGHRQARDAAVSRPS